jgi:Concanavalin A-like lectin/glucanases superfamily
MKVGDRRTSDRAGPVAAELQLLSSLALRAAGRWPGVLVLVLGGACVNLTPPPVTQCAQQNHTCREDAGRADGSRDGGPEPGELDADSPEVAPSDARTLDLGTDSTPDDAAVDTTPDRAPDTGTAASCPTGDPSLLICLRFEGSLVDESTPAATVTGTNLTFEAGMDNLAARLASSSVVRAAQGWGALDTVFTLEAWIRPDRLPTGSERMGILDEDSHFGLFLLPGGTIRCSSSGAEALASAAVAVGQWTAVACTASANRLVLWIDGVARAEGQMDGLSNGTPTTLGIGGDLPSGDPWEGLIDNLRVWSSARTAQQISAHTPAPP